MKGGGTNRCVAGAGGVDTELFAWTEVGDDPWSWGGPSWATPEKREEESLARFGPKQGRVLFFQKSFLFLFSKFILLFWKQFENSKFYGIFQSNHGPSLHIEAPSTFFANLLKHFESILNRKN
jgi:hypothetical protein